MPPFFVQSELAFSLYLIKALCRDTKFQSWHSQLYSTYLSVNVQESNPLWFSSLCHSMDEFSSSLSHLMVAVVNSQANFTCNYCLFPSWAYQRVEFGIHLEGFLTSTGLDLHDHLTVQSLFEKYSQQRVVVCVCGCVVGGVPLSN